MGRLSGRGRGAATAGRASGRATAVDAATYFPNLAGPAPWIDAEQAIVDGEVVAFDEEGRPSFSRLQEKTGLRALEMATRRADPDAPR